MRQVSPCPDPPMRRLLSTCAAFGRLALDSIMLKITRASLFLFLRHPSHYRSDLMKHRPAIAAASYASDAASPGPMVSGKWSERPGRPTHGHKPLIESSTRDRLESASLANKTRARKKRWKKKEVQPAHSTLAQPRPAMILTEIARYNILTIPTNRRYQNLVQGCYSKHTVAVDRDRFSDLLDWRSPNQNRK
ncbi:hypothetical protein RRG08_043057 [Elysia crispata]|uniref:Uncharacterized protein n=1 Tax=Elysia crispata TaxID=231223 RepID=A0AAE0XY30_9GAST|nr:hypothetical protein RRG08_043057 [Elysia crispata]